MADAETVLREAYGALSQRDFERLRSLLHERMHWFGPEPGPWDCQVGDRVLVEVQRRVPGEAEPRHSFNLVTVRDDRIVEMRGFRRRPDAYAVAT